MDKSQTAAVLVLVLALVFTTRFSIANNNREPNNVVDEEQHIKITPMWLFHRLRNAYSLYSKAFSPTSYWHLFKATLSQTYTYFFPPNIDFRSGNEVEDTNGGAGEKLKEALAKSLGTSKATLEDAAKSAADIAGETIHKVKRTLSDDEETKTAKKEL